MEAFSLSIQSHAGPHKMELHDMNKFSNIEAIRDISATIREMLGEDFDDQTFLDTLDGETDAMDMLEHLLKQRFEAQGMEVGMKETAAKYADRAKRHANKVAAMNRGIGKLLDAIGERKVTHALATVSRTKPREIVRITSESEIPTQLCRMSPDKAAIKGALLAGDTVPGASLTAGEAGIAVRVK